MKNLLSILFLTLVTLSGVAQDDCKEVTEANFGSGEDSITCRQNLSIYSEFIKQENWKEASSAWWKTQVACPQYKTLLYTNGAYIYKQLLKDRKAAKDPELNKTVDTLMMIYDLWEKNLGECPAIKIEKAFNKSQHDKGDYETIYGLYKNNLDKVAKSEVTSYDAQFYIRASFDMVRNKKNSCEDLLNDYEYLDGYIAERIKFFQDAGDAKNTEKWVTAQATAEKYIAPCASCEMFETIYKPQTDDAPENLELLKKVRSKLEIKKCYSKPYYLTIVEGIDKLEPTAESKLLLGKAKYGAKDYSVAEDYFKQAQELGLSEEQTEEVNELLLDIYERKGNYKALYNQGKVVGGCKGKYAQAKAVGMSGSSCGSTLIEKGAVYSYALQLADEAGSCVSDSWKSNMESRLPSKSDIFTLGINPGDSVDVPCWGVKTGIRIK